MNRKCLYLCPFLLLIFVVFFTPFNTLIAQCNAGEVEVLVDITPDANYTIDNTRWEVLNTDGSVFYAGTLGETICVPDNTCFDFVIYDDFGNGVAGSPPGSYAVYYDGDLVTSGVDFGSEETTDFGVCPAGSSCNFPIIGTAPGQYTAGGPDTWYEFIPANTGLYEINTCAFGNTCNTAIWVYDRCQGLLADESQEEAIMYNDDACNGDQAAVTGVFTAGVVYYIRIGDNGTDCAGTAINWELIDQGPVMGCTDPTSCNFDPLATVDDGSCIYPGDPDCPDGPDLIVLGSVIESSIYVQNLNNNDNCYVGEGCMQGYGDRQIVRFTTHIQNIGNQDYYIGATPGDPSQANDQWEWDECHNHWHYEGYAEYLLYNAQNESMPVGFKNGFCVIDLECSGGGSAKYTCSNQGITAGCGDIYNSGLACQWIDVTDVPDGDYKLVVRVNWDQSPDALGNEEITYDNNWAQVCFNLTRDGNGNASIAILASCQPYSDCLGIIQGPAAPDCNGICEGPDNAGDLNNNQIWDVGDIVQYITGILDDNLPSGPCTDMTNDDVINMEDPVWLMDCIIAQSGDPLHEGHAHSCDLPTFGIFNPNQSASFEIGAIDTVNQFLDIYIFNPTAHVMAYNFQLTGAVVSSVESLIPQGEYDVQMYSRPDGEVLGFSFTESYSPRYGAYTPFVRVHYSAVTGDAICLDDVISVVNKDHEAVTGLIGPNSCSDSASDPCTAGACTDVTLTLNFDNYPEETTWVIRNDDGIVLFSGGPYGSQPDGSTLTIGMCLSDDGYTFEISDSYGDGICCGYGNGSYSLTLDETGQVLASGGDFGSSEITPFTISGGSSGDSDGDGVCDPLDICDGGDDNVDDDGDGVPDFCDTCPGGDDNVDTDGDGTADFCDICPNAANDDSDGDGVCDDLDICPGGDDNVDSDGDGIPDFCDNECTALTLTINFDNYPEETTWEVTNSGGNVVESGGPYGSQPDGSTLAIPMCLPDDCYTFTIFDSYGDGICCGYGTGDYELVEDNTGNVIASGGEFGASEATPFCLDNFSCPDDDGDGVCNDVDVCPGGDDNVDTDGDGIADFCDDCPNSATGDTDGDGVCDDLDVCPGGDDNVDDDGDGIADFCDACPGGNDNIDTDGDGTADFCDACPNSATGDTDGDGVCDDLDVCPGGDDNADSDGDGVADFCDTCPGGDDNIDTDGDGTPDFCDACPNSATGDTDGDGVCDDLDVCPGGDDNADSDGDGVADFCDACPGGDDNIDTDGDGTPDFCDLCPNSATGDSDADGVCDDVDACPGGDDNIDTDGDGVADFCDICPGGDDNVDTNGNGIPDFCEGGLSLESGMVAGVGASWQTINLNNTYTSMVVVASIHYANNTVNPAVTRVRNANGSSFELKVQAAGGSISGTYDVYYVVVEEGIYTAANDGITMEAVKVNSAVTAGRSSGWNFEPRTYQNSYANPVVVGQVMTENDTDWSVFWASSASSRSGIPNSNGFSASKEFAEENVNLTRADETIGYLVIESGSGTIAGLDYEAGVTNDFVRGVGNSSSGYSYSLSSLNTVSSAVISAAAMDGNNGGWPVLFGSNGVSGSQLTLSYDEDIVRDSERNHTTEQVAYLAFGSTTAAPIDEPAVFVETEFGDEVINESIIESTMIQELYPNPASHQLLVDFSQPATGKLVIYDVLGRIQMIQIIEESALERLDIAKLGIGTYVLSFISSDGLRENRKFVKVN